MRGCSGRVFIELWDGSLGFVVYLGRLFNL